jgi:uncharacterized membrane protein
MCEFPLKDCSHIAWFRSSNDRHMLDAMLDAMLECGVAGFFVKGSDIAIKHGLRGPSA